MKSPRSCGAKKVRYCLKLTENSPMTFLACRRNYGYQSELASNPINRKMELLCVDVSRQPKTWPPLCPPYASKSPKPHKFFA
jgi:hypothetical protein